MWSAVSSVHPSPPPPSRTLPSSWIIHSNKKLLRLGSCDLVEDIWVLRSWLWLCSCCSIFRILTKGAIIQLEGSRGSLSANWSNFEHAMNFYLPQVRSIKSDHTWVSWGNATVHSVRRSFLEHASCFIWITNHNRFRQTEKKRLSNLMALVMKYSATAVIVYFSVSM